MADYFMTKENTIIQSPAFLIVWERIVSELALHQDMSPKGKGGGVVNPISRSVCTQDTACAAKVFALEYKRTADVKWLTRSMAAI